MKNSQTENIQRNYSMRKVNNAKSFINRFFY